jgi:hypothetical protein
MLRTIRTEVAVVGPGQRVEGRASVNPYTLEPARMAKLPAGYEDLTITTRDDGYTLANRIAIRMAERAVMKLRERHAPADVAGGDWLRRQLDGLST